MFGIFKYKESDKTRVIVTIRCSVCNSKVLHVVNLPIEMPLQTCSCGEGGFRYIYKVVLVK